MLCYVVRPRHFCKIFSQLATAQLRGFAAAGRKDCFPNIVDGIA
jgi:hypothetical protein